ncbi:unnamed protein product [Heligmosomoides polygyrus]|uniref:DUF3606 domain-containing protein n=1 Tax=Heligmosomoides polygyrus TaxID=6339 RepID=A0A183G8L5_HELPZ|nr:unnamed protein product [Heligmosomoides polygyrus]
MPKAAVDPMEVAEAEGRDGIDNGTVTEVYWAAAVARATNMDLADMQAYLYKAGKGEEARSVTLGSKWVRKRE